MTDKNKIILSRINDMCGQVQRKYVPVHTAFVSDSEYCSLNLDSLGLKCDYRFWGGYDKAERGEIIVFPDYREYDNPDELNEAGDICLLKLCNTADKCLSHRDYLGAIMALGIERDTVGDILINGADALIFIQNNIADYLMLNLEKVSSYRVKISKIDNIGDFDFIDFLPKTEAKRIVVPSLRLDAVVSEVYGLSRSESQTLIKSEKISINHIVCDKSDKLLSEGDLISTFGKGRFILSQNIGMSKKNKCITEVQIYI